MEKTKQIFFFFLLAVSASVYPQTDTISRPATYTGTVYPTWQLGQDGAQKWVKIFGDTTTLDPDGYPITKVIRRSGATRDTIALQSLSTTVYPQTFGANTSASIQAAINSINKGTVDLGSYIYTATSTITLKDSVNIVGNNFTIWTADSIINIFTAINKKDILISGGKLIGGRRKRYAPNEGSQRKKGNGFLLDNTKFVTIDNIRAYDFQNGVMDDNSNYLTVKNSYFQMRQDSAFTCLQLRGTAYSTFRNNSFIDSLHTTSGSTINAIYSYSAEQRCLDNTIEQNYFYGFGNNIPASNIGYEQTICIGWDNGKYINNYSDYGWRALDIATYPGANDRIRGFLIQGNTFRRAKQWGVRFAGNTFVTDPTQVLKYNEVVVNYFDSCRGGVLLYDSTKFTNVSLNKFRRTYGGSVPAGGTIDGTIVAGTNLSYIKIVENIIDSSGLHGIYAKNLTDSEIRENTVTWSGLLNSADFGNGIQLYSANAGLRKNKRNTISNNLVLNSWSYGIAATECEGLIFVGNKSYYNGKRVTGTDYGFVIGESDYVTAINNIASGNDYGIVVNNLTGQFLQFNTFYGNTTAGGNDYYTTSGVAAYGKYNAGTDSVKGGYAKFTGYDATGTYALKHGTTPSTAGAIRLGWGDAITARDQTNAADLYLLSTGVYGSNYQATMGSNTVPVKMVIWHEGTSDQTRFISGRLQTDVDIDLTNLTQSYKINNSKTLSRDSLALAGVAPKVRMNGKEILSETNLSMGTTTINQSAFKLNNIQILTTQQAAVSDAAGTPDLTYSQNEVDMLNSLITQLNLLLAKLRTHGLISP